MSDIPQSQASRLRREHSLIEAVLDAYAGLLEFAPDTRPSDLGIKSIEPAVLWAMETRGLVSLLDTIAIHSEAARARARGYRPSGVHEDGSKTIWRRFDA